jgi:hypothetical protein
MAKTVTKPATVKAKTSPDSKVCNYMVKKVDRVTWAAMVRRAKDEGRSLAWLFRDFIERYANGA